MKSKFDKKNLLYAMFIGIFIVLKAPSFINNIKKQGLEIKEAKTLDLKNKTETTFPNSDAIVVFWASYCAPCKIEMARLNDSVIAGKIDKNKLFAVNPFEDLATINKFINTSQLNFQFIENTPLADELNISVTPTTAFIKDNRIKSINSGLSIIGIWLAEFFY